jgi:putative membrane protein
MTRSIFKANASLVALVAAMACGAAGAQQSTTPAAGTSGTDTAATKPGATATASNAKLDRSDRKFVEEAANGGLTEVELGKLAQQKASNAQVKEFGARMVQDHSKANDELKQLAQSKGVDVPAAPGKSQQKELDKLNKLTGSKFDHEYMAHMLSDHRKDVSEFQKVSKSSKDSDVKAFADKTLPTLQEHLKLAQSVNDQVKSMK